VFHSADTAQKKISEAEAGELAREEPIAARTGM
jgi:hypothetical protein